MELGNGSYYSFLAFRGRGELFQMMGVQSVMDTTLSPPMVTPFTADILPGPSPRTFTRTFLTPRSNALVAKLIAVACAAMLVPLRVFLNPSIPHVLYICTSPSEVGVHVDGRLALGALVAGGHRGQHLLTVLGLPKQRRPVQGPRRRRRRRPCRRRCPLGASSALAPAPARP